MKNAAISNGGINDFTQNAFLVLQYFLTMKRKVLILKILLKCVLAAALFACTWNFLTPYFRESRSKEGDSFHNLPADSIDVLALGSSHIQYAFNPGVFYAETGDYSYVLGSQCQPMSMSFYMKCLFIR